MFDTKLTHAVENFVALMLPLSEKELEREGSGKIMMKKALAEADGMMTGVEK